MPKRVKGVKATKLFMKVAPRTYWCRLCGVPVVDPNGVCPRCNSRGEPIRATQPRDVRPAYDYDVKTTRNAIERCYGSKAARILMPYDGLYLLNKLQHYEAADEVIASGVIIGVRYYDAFRSEWLFKPTKHGVALILEYSIPGYARSKRRLQEGILLDKSDLYELSEPAGEAQWIALEDYYGRQGVGKITSQGRIRVASVWPRFKTPLKLWARDLSYAVKVNTPILEEFENEAISFIEKELKSRSGRPIITISGGKDSTITAYLASCAGVRDAIFVDTGIEHPETIDNVERAASLMDLNLHVASAGDRFWRLVKLFGPPARDYRWCTRLVKLAVMAHELKRMNITRMISITGQRAVESTSRAQAGRVAPTGPPNPEGVMIAPIHYWSSLVEHMYIRYRSLPLHPLYPRGYERIGCFLCPTSRLPELEDVGRRHPDLWGRWLQFLEEWRRHRKLPEEWVRLGLWRWRLELPGDLRVLASRRGIDPTLLLKSHSTRVALASVGDTWELVVLDVGGINLEEFAGLGRVLGYTVSRGNGFLEFKRSDGIEFRVDPRPAVTVLSGGVRALFDALCLIYMYCSCTPLECRLCVMICSKRAISISNSKPKVDVEKCDSCKRCLRICPAVLRAREAFKQALNLIQGVKRGLGS